MHLPAQRSKRKARVVSSPNILGGTPVVEGTRIPAETVLIELRATNSTLEVFRAYPSLPPDGIDACVEWERAGKPL